jgi:hypothetical protein
MVEETDKVDHFHHSIVCSLLTQKQYKPITSLVPGPRGNQLQKNIKLPKFNNTKYSLVATLDLVAYPGAIMPNV